MISQFINTRFWIKHFTVMFIYAPWPISNGRRISEHDRTKCVHEQRIQMILTTIENAISAYVHTIQMQWHEIQACIRLARNK